MPRVPLPRGAELGRRDASRSKAFPRRLRPGERYTLTVTLTRAGMKRAGFQLAARFKDSGAQAGTLAPGPGDAERVGVETPGRRPVRGPEEGRILGRRSRRGAVDDRVDRAGPRRTGDLSRVRPTRRTATKAPMATSCTPRPRNRRRRRRKPERLPRRNEPSACIISGEIPRLKSADSWARMSPFAAFI